MLEVIDKESSGNETFDEEIIGGWRKSRLKEKIFILNDDYPADEVRTDMEECESLEKNYFEREGAGATGLHFGVMEGIELYDWLGPNASVIFTSKYDDIKNGVDLLVQFTDENGEITYLAIDVTANDDPTKLTQKLQRSIEDLKRGKLSKVKYFAPPKGAETFKIEGKKAGINVPRAVIGANTENTQKMIGKFAAVYKQGGRKNLGNYELQHALMEEIEAQLLYQLQTAIETLDKKFGQQLPAELICKDLKEWETNIDIENLGLLSDEQAQELNKIVSDYQKEIGIVPDNYGKNIKLLARALGVINSIRNEKGASSETSAHQNDATFRKLSRPRTAA